MSDICHYWYFLDKGFSFQPSVCNNFHDVLMMYVKVGFSPFKTICVIRLIESPLKLIKNAFYFILKALFVLKIFKFLSRLFGHVEKTA